jgi:uncharacterized membrane protein
MMQREATLPTILLASATGARTMTGLAAVARSVGAREPVSRAAAALAVMELLADKLPGIPNRTDPLPLLGRAAAGALIGATIAAAFGGDRAHGATLGAVAAVIAAHLSFHARRELAERLPDTLAAVVEDVAVGCLARAGLAAINQRRPS